MDAWEEIRTKADFDSQRIDEIEAVVHHDVIAFLTSVAEYVGPSSRYIHLGMTSSDVLDTATSIQLREAGSLLLKDLQELRVVLGKKALEHKDTVCIGRSHGIHAEPTTFGLKLALWYDEAGRNLQRLEGAVETIRAGKISGSVGTFAHLDPEVEERVCEKLGLIPAPVSTQVVQRDRHAYFLSTLAVIGASLEKIAVEIRHLQRTEVLEAEEFFACPINAIPLPANGLPVWPGCSAPMPWPPLRMLPYGMNVTSPTHRWNALFFLTARFFWII